VFIILKQSIDNIKVETDVSVHNEEDVIGMETDAVCVPQGSEYGVSHLLRWFLWWWLLICILLCVVLHTWNCRNVSIYRPVCSFASVIILRADTVSEYRICRRILSKSESVMLALNSHNETKLLTMNVTVK
jgi:hypothetical protein